MFDRHPQNFYYWFCRYFFTILLVITTGMLTACGDNPKANQPPTPEPSRQSSLTFREVTLEKFDENGQPLWKVNAQNVVYSQDNKIANVLKPKGNLFQEGQVVLQVEADRGQIFDDGRQVLLDGNIVAIDPRNQAVLKGNKVEWNPEKSILVIQDNLRGNNAQLQASARIGRYFTKEQRMELQGQVVATVKDPPLRIQTRYLQWFIAQEKVTGDRTLRVAHYEKSNTPLSPVPAPSPFPSPSPNSSPNSSPNPAASSAPNQPVVQSPELEELPPTPQKLIQQVEAEEVEYNLKTKIAIFKKNVQLNSIEPLAQAVSNNVVWNVADEIITSPETIKIVQAKDQITVTGNQGILNLKTKMANLTGGVQATSDQRKSVIFANQMQWNLDTQDLQATGHVIYQQVNPTLKVVGSEASGKLNTENIVVTGTQNPGGQVVTEIIPEQP
jgi:LPS export ABC transporter protein LptC